SRGLVVNTEDLVEQLEAGKVTGACLDVLEYEGTSFEALHNTELPAAFQYLRDSDRVVLSPHIAGWTHEAYRKMSVALGNKIGQVFVEQQAPGNQPEPPA
ncbi:MAG: NAD(P)-dependent oxidoreductase, partial [Bacteroidota bacterium]